VSELESNQNIVHKVCSLYTNDAHSHNDLFQEISIQLWKAYPKFRGESKFSTWMYRVSVGVFSVDSNKGMQYTVDSKIAVMGILV